MPADKPLAPPAPIRPAQMPDQPLSASVKYNPHLWGDVELRAIFVVRRKELEGLLEAVRSTAPDSVPQHFLITGHRGMGKSTLLRRIALAVRDDAELSRSWLALSFPEEQYTVSNLAEFWQNVLDALADALEQQGGSVQELADLDAAIARIETLPAPQREEAALGLLTESIARRGQRILLLIDSTDLLFAGLAGGGKGDGGATPLWRLRKTLSHEKGIFWVGASYLALESENQYQDAFHDFFQLLPLRALSVEDMRQAMLALARTFGMGPGFQGDAAEKEMARALDTRPERLKVLRAMTGGNPRTTVMLYDLFAAGGYGNVHSDLRGLLDMMTPLYKARMESLADQPRKLLAHLMELWAPQSAKALADASGVPVTTVNGQLSRLEAEGLVEKVRLPGSKRHGYQAAERFFNIWYLMRFASRRLRQRLTWLVEFMRLWFSAEELTGQAVSRAGRHGGGGLCGESDLEYSRALAAALPEGHRERYRLEWSVFAAARGVARDTRRALQDIFDLDGEDRQFATASDYLERFNALDEELARCSHIPEGEKANWIAVVKSSLDLDLPAKEFIADQCVSWSRSHYHELRQALEYEKEERCSQHSAEAVDAVYQAVLAGEFFPDCPDAELAYTQLVAAFGDAPEAYCLGLNQLAARHKDAWLEKACKTAIEMGVVDSVLWSNLGGLLQYSLARSEESEAAYRKAIELDPMNTWAWYGLGNLLKVQLKRYDEAEVAYRKAIQLHSNDAAPWIGLGNVLQDNLQRYEEAETAYQKAIQLDPKTGAPWCGMGDLLQVHLKRYEEAEAAYLRAIELDAGNAHPWFGLAHLFQVHLKRNEEAEKAYRKAIELDDEMAAPWNNLGDLLKDHLKRYDEAEVAYRKAINLDAGNARPWNGLGSLLQEHLNRYEEAEAAYRKAIELDAESTWPWNNLGNLLQNHLNRYEEAEGAFRKAIELDPGNAWAWNGLGNLLLDHLKRYGEAEVAFRKATELDPTDPYPRANLARIMAVQGKSDEATTLYRQTLALAEAKRAEDGGGGCEELLLQSHLWLGNRGDASQFLERLASRAAEGDESAFFRLKEQAWECSQIGRWAALADLMGQSAYAEFLKPFALALRAVEGAGEDALGAAAPEMASLAREVWAEIRQRTAPPA